MIVLKESVYDVFGSLAKILGSLLFIQFLLRTADNFISYVYDPLDYRFIGFSDGIIVTSSYFLAFFLGYQWIKYLFKASRKLVTINDLWPKFIFPALICWICFLIFLLPLEILFQQFSSGLVSWDSVSFSFGFSFTFLAVSCLPLLIFVSMLHLPLYSQSKPDFELFIDALIFLPLFITIQNVAYAHACYMSENPLFLLLFLAIFLKGSEILVQEKNVNRPVISHFFFVNILFPLFWIMLAPNLVTPHAVCH